MTRLLVVVVLVVVLQGCEPCAVVMGGHCQDREHHQDDEKVAPSSPFAPRGSARG